MDVYIDGNYLASSPPLSFIWNSGTVANGSHTHLGHFFRRFRYGDRRFRPNYRECYELNRLVYGAPPGATEQSATLARERNLLPVAEDDQQIACLGAPATYGAN